jgi:alanine dehydrogenase
VQIGIPREIKDSEGRVALAPSHVATLVADGHEVFIEQGAGSLSGFTDDDYQTAGAQVLPSPAAVFERSEMILKVKEPLEPEWSMLREGQILFTYLHLAASLPLTQALMERGIIGVAYETIELADGFLPLLAPMSAIAGRLAAQVGSNCLMSPAGGSGKLMSGVPGVLPANVLVLGGGVVGANAARVAYGMGAVVTILDVNTRRLMQLEDQMPQAHTAFSNRGNLLAQLPRTDLLIGAVLVHGARAPHLLSRSDLALLPYHSVVVDVAVDQGGCLETTRPTTHSDPTYYVDGILHYGVANMPGAVPHTSTLALANESLPYVRSLAAEGVEHTVKNDRAMALGVNLWKGRLTSEPVARSLGLPYTPLEEALYD